MEVEGVIQQSRRMKEVCTNSCCAYRWHIAIFACYPCLSCTSRSSTSFRRGRTGDVRPPLGE